MTITIEFPMMVLNEYGSTGGVYQTLDDHITDLIQKPFEERGTAAKINRIDFVDPTPNVNDELVRYELDVEDTEDAFKPKWILEALEAEGFEKGVTIKDHHGESLYNDAYTADIPLRRKAQDKF